MSSGIYVVTCPACKSADSQSLIELSALPVFANVPQPSPEVARSVERGDISLVACTDCAHVYNRAFDYRCVQYAPGYENAMHHSPRFRAYAQELIERLDHERPLSGAQVLELGCGDGSFLAMLALRGAKCTGFETKPAHLLYK